MKSALAMAGVLALAFYSCAGTTSSLESARPDPVLQTALQVWGLTERDLTIPVGHLTDALRPEAARRTLEDPRHAWDLSQGLAEELTGSRASAALALAQRQLGIEPVHSTEGRDLRPETAPLAGLDPSLAELLVPLLDELDRGRREVEAEQRRFSRGEQKRIRGLFDLVDPNRGLPEADADSLIVVAGKLDLGVMAGAAARLLKAGERFAAGAKDLPMRVWPPAGEEAAFDTPAGRVVVGGTGENAFGQSAALIVDPAGDDQYGADAHGGSGRPAVSLVIDLAGADEYVGAQGGGLFGVCLLLDLAGDDAYAGGQGVGVAGVGIVEDRAGDDVYRTDLGGQGFGLFGIGILCDLEGGDRYKGDLLAQGAAGPGGCGVLCDGAGDDRYEAGGRYADFREEGVHLSMAQGFSGGIRPLASGGMGVLYDEGGDDTYEAEYFAQGSSFWGGAGVLIDRAGRDRYEARRYAQGSGSHLAVGVLLDEAGDDRYSLWGVGQGCGHDLSVGALIDRQGDDEYLAEWLAQGAGNANGVGMLDEREGDDLYSAGRDDTQGYGSAYRDHGSIGLLIDRAGVDRYVGAGQDDSLWTGGTCGTGVDVRGERDAHR